MAKIQYFSKGRLRLCGNEALMPKIFQKLKIIYLNYFSGFDSSTSESAWLVGLGNER
jgi:hypothetical protein